MREKAVKARMVSNKGRMSDTTAQDHSSSSQNITENLACRVITGNETRIPDWSEIDST